MTLPTAAERAEGRAPASLTLFLALMTSVVAMTIDAVLPALDAIAEDLAFAHPNDRQLVVLAVLLGMGLSQPVFGTLSDGIGRRGAALLGWGVYLAGAALCLAAAGPEAMLAGRFLQGFGAGGPRTVAVAIVRDLYEGRAMARMLSLVMTVFMLVPMLAPLAGQGLEALAGWRAVFWAYGGLALLAAAWYLAAVPETLTEARRRPLALRPVLAGFAEVLSSRVAMGYTLATACVFGPFIVHIATAQQVLEELYGLGPLFPVAFGALALAFAAASLANARLVMAFGMRRIARTGVGVLALAGGGGALAAGLAGGAAPLWLHMALMAVVFACVGALYANFNALALAPLGHLAGTASAVVMSLTTLGAAPLGLVIARQFDGSTVPMFAGFLLLGLAARVAMALAEGGRR